MCFKNQIKYTVGLWNHENISSAAVEAVLTSGEIVAEKTRSTGEDDVCWSIAGVNYLSTEWSQPLLTFLLVPC